jgi:hypothetical protein
MRAATCPVLTLVSFVGAAKYRILVWITEDVNL